MKDEAVGTARVNGASDPGALPKGLPVIMKVADPDVVALPVFAEEVPESGEGSEGGVQRRLRAGQMEPYGEV